MFGRRPGPTCQRWLVLPISRACLLPRNLICGSVRKRRPSRHGVPIVHAMSSTLVVAAWVRADQAGPTTQHNAASDRVTCIAAGFGLVALLRAGRWRCRQACALRFANKCPRSLRLHGEMGPSISNPSRLDSDQVWSQSPQTWPDPDRTRPKSPPVRSSPVQSWPRPSPNSVRIWPAHFDRR